MSIITRMRKQQALYWEVAVKDGKGGHTFADAVIIDCRWEDITTDQISDKGEKIVSSTTVYVDRDVLLDGYLAKYENELPLITDNPEKIREAFKIVKFNKLPNLRNTEELKTAFL